MFKLFKWIFLYSPAGKASFLCVVIIIVVALTSYSRRIKMIIKTL